MTQQDNTALMVAPRQQFDLSPQTFEQALTFAKYLAESEMVPKQFRNKPGDCLIAMQWGYEVNFKPLQALQSIAVINSKPSIYGDAGKAILLAAGCAIDEDDMEVVKRNNRARCKITRPGRPPCERTFSLEDAKTAGLFAEIVKATADLAASWMAAGFVHGVLNTDNLNVTGESFDYGPWRFLPTNDPSFTAAYFDETGLYAFGRQPEAVSWALAQLGGALSLICPVALLEPELARFAPAYQRALRDHVFARLALTAGDEAADLDFLQALFNWTADSQVGWDQFFHDWRGANALRAAESPAAARYAEPAFTAIRDGLEARGKNGALDHPYWQRPTPETMVIDEVERIWAAIAERDDWSAFEQKLSAVAELRAALG